MEQLKIRTACPEDGPALLEIYRPYVENTVITFEYRVPEPEEFSGRIARTLERYPWLTAELEGVPAGYAYASAFKGRAAYDWSVETSVYVREDLRGRGIGGALYRALEEILARQNVQNLNACITWPNPESVAFHERSGYAAAAHFHRCGYKAGRWMDVIWMEKFLGEHRDPPERFLPFRELAQEAGSRIGNNETEEKE